MRKLTPSQFSQYFIDLWGHPPFDWQSRLAHRVLTRTESPWPQAIALPTASGKTACLDIAVFALACCASDPDIPGNHPRRIFFVVDRRVIVDEAFERACRLSEKLRNPKTPLLEAVAHTLKTLACSDIALECHQLRGGMYRSDAWARSPIQPAIIASTVDQIGSRILFRAYGRSPNAWPIQAGLAGNDALILLDEAHCARPFMETLQAVAKYRQLAQHPLATPFHVAIMSATPPPEITDVFKDASQEPKTAGHPLGDRQMAAKPAQLQSVMVTQANAIDKLANALAKSAMDLAETQTVADSPSHPAVVVFCNRVATARLAHEQIAKKYGHHAVLLTGRMRPIDKDDTVAQQLALLSADRSRNRSLEHPMFVVATQTLEVGANLDFDMLVTECASLDALRQRFGRLNRMGRPIQAEARIWIRSDQAKSSDDDPVYGSALGRTWQWLQNHADDSGTLDMGIQALDVFLDKESDLSALSAPTPQAPVMLPAHVDLWVQTQPTPVPEPDVAVFLHGRRDTALDVQVCWRADLDLTTDQSCEASLDVLSLCPPASPECVPVPLWMVRKWLQAGSLDLDLLTDVEGAAEPMDRNTESDTAPSQLRVIKWLGRDEAEVISNPDGLKPGNVVVIPADAPNWRMLADLPDFPTQGPVLDWGDRAHAMTRNRIVLRLHPKVLAQWPQCPAKQILMAFLDTMDLTPETDLEDLIPNLKETLAEATSQANNPDWIDSLLTNIRVSMGTRHFSIIRYSHGTGLILRGIKPAPEAPSSIPISDFTDEDDATASGTGHVLLTDHLERVSGLAARFGQSAGLPDTLVAALALAGQCHDLGKADPRFQSILRGGSPWARALLLAKSLQVPQSLSAYQKACQASGYPAGNRHELLSVRLMENFKADVLEDPIHRELVYHLVATHHGRCRPMAPVISDPQPVSVTVTLASQSLEASSATGLERIDSGIAQRFWKLTRYFGWWGLVWLEALIRLADHRVSESESNERKGGAHD